MRGLTYHHNPTFRSKVNRTPTDTVSWNQAHILYLVTLIHVWDSRGQDESTMSSVVPDMPLSFGCKTSLVT